MKGIRTIGIFVIALAIIATPLSVGFAGDDIWTPVEPYGVEVWTINADPVNPLRMYAGTDKGFYQSDDGGAIWTRVNELPYSTFYNIAIDPDDHQIVYIGGQSGVYVSRNGGLSWNQTNLKTWVMSLAIDPVNPQVLYAGDWYGATVFKSIDGGDSWVPLSVTSLGDAVRAIVIDPNDPQILYAGGSGIFKSLDGGAHWMDLGLPLNISSLSLRTDNSQILYAGIFNGGLFVTDNGGKNWLPVGNVGSLDVRDVMADPINSGRLYLAVQGNAAGIYRSDDNGQTWNQMLSGMGERNMLSVFVSTQTPQTIFGGSIGTGIWAYTLTSALQDYSLSINAGALYTNATTVDLTLTAPPGTTQMMLSNDGGFSGASWESFSQHKSWVITSYGSYVLPRIVYAKFKTNGQTSGLYQDDIVLDVTAPHGEINILSAIVRSYPSILENTILPATREGFSYTTSLPIMAWDYRPGYTSIELGLTADDDISGVGDMLIGTAPDLAGAVWQSFRSQVSWWVPEGSSGTVYAMFRDRAGNLSSVDGASYTP